MPLPSFCRTLVVLGSLAVWTSGAAAQADPKAVAVLDRAITRMGGETALRAIQTIRMDQITQWQGTHFSEHPYADRPSFERTVDLRDYASRSWRNTRNFLPQGMAVDIVRDTVGGRTLAGQNGALTQVPLNIAYVDDRRELFAFAPERTLFLAREAADLTLLSDSLIDGVAHARVRATVDRFPATWFLRRTDGMLSMVRFMADETNDFGLAPWGPMEVEFWYSGWAPVQGGTLLPRQRDVRRVGRPYKRMTILSLAVNVPAPADSFALADSTVAQYLATQQRPMWDTPLDSARIVERDFATFPPFTGSAGAVRIGGQWVLLETAQRDGAVQRLVDWFARTTPESPVAAGLVSNIGPSNGGAKWFTTNRKPVYAAVGAMPNLRRIVGAAQLARLTAVPDARWVRVGTDSLWLERLDSPDGHGVLAVYSPTLRWVYGARVVGAPAARMDFEGFVARLRARGLAVEWMGNTRALRTAVPPAAK